MNRYRNILVALACAAPDRALLEYAAMLGGFGAGTSFQLVHVLSNDSSISEAEAHECILAALPPAFRAMLNAGRASCSVLRGDRLDALLEFAAAKRIDLVLLGHRRNRSGRRSLARRLAMSAPCSVWLVPEGCPPKLGRILVPVDFSMRAADAIVVATTLAAAAGLEKCYALHVRFNPAAVTFDEYEEIEMAEEQDAFTLFLARIDLHGVDVEPIFEEGLNVAAAISRVAEEKSADLIVMGTRGRSRAASVLLGSETEQTIIESTLPVLAIKHFGARLRLLQALLEDRFRQQGNLRFT
jgi:nucleotide-binding universal stress UspA family protein